MIDQRFREHPKKHKKANAAARKLKTIAGRLVRDVERGLDKIDRLDQHDEQLWLYYRVLGQKRDDNNKLYSLHAPEVKCIVSACGTTPLKSARILILFRGE